MNNGSRPQASSSYNLKICNQVLNDFYTDPQRCVVDPRMLANKIPLRGNEPPLPPNQPWRMLSVHRKLWHFSDEQMVRCLEALKVYYTNHKRGKDARNDKERLMCTLVPALIEYYAAVCLELEQTQICQSRDRYLDIAFSQRQNCLIAPAEVRCFIDLVLYELDNKPQPMSYAELETLCSVAFGSQWQKSAADFFGISKASISGWKTKNQVPLWVAYCRSDLLEQLMRLKAAIDPVMQASAAMMSPNRPRYEAGAAPESVDDIFAK